MKSGCREVNLEAGMPTVERAVKRLTFEIHNSRGLGFAVLKIIHGYGSSGTGGRIRVEARRYLESMKRRRQIVDYVAGEDFSIFDAASRALLQKCPDLSRDHDLYFFSPMTLPTSS